MSQVSVRVVAVRAMERTVFGRRVISIYDEHLPEKRDRLVDWGGRLSPLDLFGFDVLPCGAVLHFFLSLRLVDIPPGDWRDQLSKEWPLLRDRESMAICLAL